MKPLKFNVVGSLGDDWNEGWDLDEYFAARPGIKDGVDIFQKNGREKTQTYTRFDLFEEAPYEEADFIVSPYYLELFEFANQTEKMIEYIKFMAKAHPKVVFQWNHDNDFARYIPYINTLENIRIINFGNTTCKMKQDITVPFWNINTTPIEKEKRFYCSFIGSVNNPLRLEMVKGMEKDPDFRWLGGLEYQAYLETVSASTFSLCPLGGPGGSGFSYRFFECMHLNTIPVIIVDCLTFPYERLDWTDLCVRIPERKAGDMDYIRKVLDDVDVEYMLNYIKMHRTMFTLGGVQQEVSRELA
jgi:hypothetical protein